MSKISQKEAVVSEVLLTLPLFKKNIDNALSLLSSQQLEAIKVNVMNGILNGTIEYSKDINNQAEVRTYARSMVMNHLKKAKELNGGQTNTPSVTSNTNVTPKVFKEKGPKGVDMASLPDYLKEAVRGLM